MTDTTTETMRQAMEFSQAQLAATVNPPERLWWLAIIQSLAEAQDRRATR